MQRTYNMQMHFCAKNEPRDSCEGACQARFQTWIEPVQELPASAAEKPSRPWLCARTQLARGGARRGAGQVKHVNCRPPFFHDVDETLTFSIVHVRETI
jgi:hypothetical protein